MFNCVKLVSVDQYGYGTVIGIFKDEATAEYVRDLFPPAPSDKSWYWKLDWAYIANIGF